jgi:two-component system sensor histidine kinase KdpD
MECDAVKRGCLKVFFGYAPGLGKTYAMLEAARVAVAGGRSVLVGYANTHGRPEVEALLVGLTVLPLKEIDYRGARLAEFDLEAALNFKADLVVVDELAHTNAAGCRNRKRWQDVQELLEAGSDVWTTLNLQHIESVRDVVTQITGVVVRDSLPDHVFDEAAEVELVDLPPDELLERSREGKAHLAERVSRSVVRPLRKGSLVALREMAMRRVADRVGRDVQAVRLGDAHTHGPATAERLLVCVDASPGSARLIRAARRMASATHAPWTAIHVQTPAENRLDERGRRMLAQNMRLADHLGGETVTVSGADVAREVVRYARAHNVTKTVIGTGGAVPLYCFWRRPVADRVIGLAGDMDVHVIHAVDEQPPSLRTGSGIRHDVRDYLLALAMLLLATAVAAGFDRLGLTDANLVTTYLLAIALVAMWWGRGPAVVSSLASVLLYNFLFTTPYFTLVVDDPQNIYTFAVMLSIALIVSELTSRVREQANLAVEREHRAEALYRVSHALANTSGRLQLVAVAQEELTTIFGGQVAVFVPERDSLRPVLRRGNTLAETPDEADAALWAFEHRRTAGRGTDVLPGAQALYLPLNGSESTVGVLAWQPEDESCLVNPAQRQLLDAVSTQIAMALERDWLAQETQRVLTEADAERSRSSLLSVVSHDLRTPLAAIAGSASSLVVDKLDAETREDLARTIYEEADRLTRLVENLLHLTRIESGAMKVEKQWQPLEEVVGSALRRVETALGSHEVQLDLPFDLPLVPMDGLLVEQVLVNLLDNAAKYSGEGSPIDLVARLASAGVEVTVADRGPGLAEAEQERVFERFYRGTAVRSDRGRGAGMGLAICRAVVTAHGGRIWVEPRVGGGSCFKFVLPVEGTPPVEEAPASRERKSDA